ncbi:MAG: iron-containing redox enzyme family protein [bacterium JZ-2024 1]
MNDKQKLLNRMVDTVRPYRLLGHPFYVAWNKGEVPLEALRQYAMEYARFVEAFPEFWEMVLADRRVNPFRGDVARVVSEERQHARLWRSFLEALGRSTHNETQKNVRALVNRYRELCADGLGSALGALFAFENQAAEVAHTKHDGLVAHYGVTGEEGLAYFREHFAEDETHLKVQKRLIELLSPEEREQCVRSAGIAAEALYRSLDAFARASGITGN